MTRRTWDARHRHHQVWAASGGGVDTPVGFIPLGIRRLACGCFVDDFSHAVIWEPCRAHEADGHLAEISGTGDGLSVASCLVLRCSWQETRFTETDAVLAAQAHWRNTLTQIGTHKAGNS